MKKSRHVEAAWWAGWTSSMAVGSSRGRGSEVSEEGEACAGSGIAKDRLRRNGLVVWHGSLALCSRQSISERKDRLKQNPAYGPSAWEVAPLLTGTFCHLSRLPSHRKVHDLPDHLG